MNRHIVRALLALVMSVASMPLAMAQQSNRVPPLLLLPGGTRAMGLGDAFVAGQGPEVLFYNPAQLGASRGTTLSFQRFGSVSSLGSLATSTLLLGASIGAGVQYLEYQSRTMNGSTGVRDLSRWGAYDASNFIGSVGAAIERKGIRIGVTTKYAQQQLAGRRSGVPSVDLGVATNIASVTIGLAVQDASALIGGRNRSGIHLPSRISLGGMISDQRLGTWFDFGASASITAVEGGRFVPAGGVELTYVPVSGWSLVARVGGHGLAGPGHRGESPLSLGATLGIDRLAVDYAFQPDAVHRIGVRIRP